MSLSTVFNGATLVKPGAASRVISKLQSVGAAGVNNLGLIGTADAGPPGLSVFTSAEQMKATYRSGDLADAAGLAFNPSNDPRIAGGPLFVFGYRVTSSATPPTRSTGAIKNVSAADVITLTAKDYGSHTNRITVAYNSSAKVLTLKFNDGLSTFTEQSAPFASTRFTIHYAGAGTAPTITVNATQVSFAVTGAAGDVISGLTFADYPTLGDLLAAIALNTNWVVTLKSNPAAPSSALDRITAGAIGTSAGAATAITGLTQEVIDWVNANSSLVTAVRSNDSTVGYPNTLAETALTGAVSGATPTSSDWDAGFTAMKQQRIHALVPLHDRDVGGGATAAAVAASTLAYANAMNSTLGRNEVQVYYGKYVTGATAKQDIKDAASLTFNSPHVCVTFDQLTLPDRNGNLKVFPAWSSALSYAAMRIAAPLGEPLTFKYVRAFGLTKPSTIDAVLDLNELLLAGVTVFEYVRGKGYRIVKGNTSYTKTDDDAYTEESVVCTWKAIIYDLRTFLEDTFTGTKGTPGNVAAIADMAGAKLETYRDLEAIVDTTDESGKPLHAWRDLVVKLNKDVATLDVAITVVEGINFQLPTLYLTPVRLSA